MNPTIMTARVTDQHLLLVNEPLIASGGVDVIQIRFEFCGLWDGCGKTAVFYRDPEEVYHVPITDNLATVPHEVLSDEGYFYFGVMGAKSNVRTTEVVKVSVEQGAITTATANSEKPTPDIYQQLMAAYGKTEQAIAVERARIDEMVKLRGDGPSPALEDFTFEDEYIHGTIVSNGTAARILLTVSYMSLQAGGHHYTDYCIPPALAPLCDVHMGDANLNITIGANGLSDEGWARILIENPSNSNWDTDMEMRVESHYPLAVIGVPEVDDIRVGIDGHVYGSAGDAVRAVADKISSHFLFNYGYAKTEYGYRSIYGGITLDNGYISKLVEVEEGDILSVTCTTPASVGFAAVIFYDESMSVVSFANENADNKSYSYTDLIVRVPAQARYAATASPYQYECKLGKLTTEPTSLPLRGKTIVNLGDSIFGNVHDDTSVSSLLAQATYANCVNCGFGGTKMVNRMLQAGATLSGYEDFDFENLVNAIVSGNYQNQKNAISWYSLPDYFLGSLYVLEKIDFTKVDIVTLNFGTNDYTYGEKGATLKAKYAEAVAKLQAAFPNLTVVIISPTWRCWLNADGSFQEDSNTKIWWSTGDSTLVDYCNTLQELAKELNVQYIDVYNIGINKNTWTHYFTEADTTHQNLEGRKRIARVIAKNLC